MCTAEACQIFIQLLDVENAPHSVDYLSFTLIVDLAVLFVHVISGA